MMIDRRLIQNFNWSLMSFIFLLILLGLIPLHSAAGSNHLYIRQLIWYCIGFASLMVVVAVDYKYIEKYAYLIYGSGICMLIGVLLFGRYAGGSKRWLSVGPISIQPSELLKIMIVISIARYCSKCFTKKGFTFKELAIPAVLTALPVILTAVQPDLGTAMLIFLISATMILILKINTSTLIFLLSVSAAAVPGFWKVLKPYQKQRISSFLNPELDPLGAGYHLIQSKIAIGSGSLTGKGLKLGTQNALSFLPESHTDFIFAVLSEEWGFVGSFIIVMMFMILILWGFHIAYKSKDLFGAILALGISVTIFWQVVINICMVTGLMPVVGVPLPFVSYGGSSAVTMMIGVGILLNVSMRRYLFE